ncbi:MAG: tRNA lysidine(34) synthetase TilS, partial [Bdellovibrionales bacterium]|nr:tRNA lysidine(34) synthetase TilS [Bdellovibrionales bacterium]
MSKAKHHLEHIILKNSPKAVKEQKIIVAVSGGADSMGLLKALLQTFPPHNLVAAYFHHGDHLNKEYRHKAQELIKEVSKKYGVIFETEKSQNPLVSESECRVARNRFLAQTAMKHNTSVVAFAHHLDDWLETQLIKMIRGCSFQSLHQKMILAKDNSLGVLKWRPWIEIERLQIKEYVIEDKIEFIDDPSNETL